MQEEVRVRIHAQKTADRRHDTVDIRRGVQKEIKRPPASASSRCELNKVSRRRKDENETRAIIRLHAEHSKREIEIEREREREREREKTIKKKR